MTKKKEETETDILQKLIEKISRQEALKLRATQVQAIKKEYKDFVKSLKQGSLFSLNLLDNNFRDDESTIAEKLYPEIFEKLRNIQEQIDNINKDPIIPTYEEFEKFYKEINEVSD
jgi:hypothetical protein